MEQRKLPRGEHGWVSEYCIVRYDFASQFVRDKTVLDVGCGVGYGASCLMRGSPKMVIGGDISREHAEYAKALFGGERLNFLCLDAHLLPFHDQSIDVMVSMDVIEHLRGYEGFLRECRRALKEGGVLICTTPNKEVSSPGAKLLNPYHEKEFSIDELRQLLEKHFDEVAIYGMEPQGRTDKTIYKLVVGIGPKISLYMPGVWRLILRIAKSVTRLIFHRYRFVWVEKIEGLDFKTLDKGHTPFPISNSLIVPRHILGLAYKRGFK